MHAYTGAGCDGRRGNRVHPGSACIQLSPHPAMHLRRMALKMGVVHLVLSYHGPMARHVLLTVPVLLPRARLPSHPAGQGRGWIRGCGNPARKDESLRRHVK